MVFIKFAESPSLLIILRKGQAFGRPELIPSPSIINFVTLIKLTFLSLNLHIYYMGILYGLNKITFANVSTIKTQQKFISFFDQLVGQYTQ